MVILDEDDQLVEMVKMCNDNGMIPKFAVLFIADDDVIMHSVFYEQRPSVPDVLHNIEEMRSDKDFGIGEEETNLCSMVILPIADGGDIE